MPDVGAGILDIVSVGGIGTRIKCVKLKRKDK